MTTDLPPKLDLSAGQAEEISGISRKVLARMARRGDIIGAQPGGRMWRYSRESIEAYLASLVENDAEAIAS